VPIHSPFSEEEYERVVQAVTRASNNGLAEYTLKVLHD
jgi:hypothetical protein